MPRLIAIRFIQNHPGSGSSDQDVYSVLQRAARCGGTEIIELLYLPVLDMQGLRSMKHSWGTGVGAK